MLVKAEQKFLRISQRKVNLLTKEVIRLVPQEALLRLKFARQQSATAFSKVIKQAISNATNVKNLDEKTLKFKSIFVNKGATLKRWRAKARGRISQIKKRS